MEKAVALVSGGLKSAVMVAAERERYDLLPLHVQTGSRVSEAEHASVAHVCEKLNVARPAVVALPRLADLITHPWFDAEASPDDLMAQADVLDAHIPGLMPLLLDVAVLYALHCDARRILVGACEAPSTLMPLNPVATDQRKEFYQVYNEMLATMMPVSPPAVSTPLIDLPFAEIVKLGQRLRAPLEVTWSCLAASDDPCGQCAGCRNRTQGFLQAGQADPAVASVRG